MTVTEIIALCSAGALGLSAIVEITPIKLNPWSKIAHIIGHAINKEMMDELSGMKTEIAEVKKDIKELRDIGDEREAENTRVRILGFGDEILHGMRYSKEHYDMILNDITNYGNYCTEHPDFKNDMTIITTQNIKKHYQLHLDNDDFL